MYAGANIRGPFKVYTSIVELKTRDGARSYKLQLECGDGSASLTMWFDDGIEALKRYRDEVVRIVEEHEHGR